MQMKISTNCSPLVIYFGFFFQTKQSHSQREGAGGVGLGWGGGWGATGEPSRRKGGGGTKGTDLGTEMHVSYQGAGRLGGLPIRTHTLLEKKESGSVCRGAIAFHQAT